MDSSKALLLIFAVCLASSSSYKIISEDLPDPLPEYDVRDELDFSQEDFLRAFQQPLGGFPRPGKKRDKFGFGQEDSLRAFQQIPPIPRPGKKREKVDFGQEDSSDW